MGENTQLKRALEKPSLISRCKTIAVAASKTQYQLDLEEDNRRMRDEVLDLEARSVELEIKYESASAKLGKYKKICKDTRSELTRSNSDLKLSEEDRRALITRIEESHDAELVARRNSFDHVSLVTPPVELVARRSSFDHVVTTPESVQAAKRFSHA